VKIKQLTEGLAGPGNEYEQATVYGDPYLIINTSATADLTPFKSAISSAMKWAAEDDGTLHIESKVLESTKGLPPSFQGALLLANSPLADLTGLSKFSGRLEAPKCKLAKLTLNKHMYEVDVDKNQLTSLVGGPEVLEASFSAAGNNLTSFAGVPKHTESVLQLQDNHIESFEGAEGIFVGDELHLQSNQITSLRGIDKVIAQAQVVYLEGNPIKAHLLNVFNTKINEVFFADPKLSKIINTHLANGNTKASMIACQDDLIDAGYSQELASL
jgi:hypothetical protein